ncbi:MAG: hypothetical protein KGL39_54910 [Patescibacteria group bacterium]|nr:hypothetical protein [Patescibacteria group bacterium]
MKKLLAIALCLLSLGAAAQTGVFPTATVWGNATGGNAQPKATPFSSFSRFLPLTTNHIFVGNAGIAADVSMSGDCAISYLTGNGQIICTKTNGVAFGSMATQNVTAGGDLTGSWPSPTLAAIGAATGPIGDATHSLSVTIDTKGRVTALTSNAIAPGLWSLKNFKGDPDGTSPTSVEQLSADAIVLYNSVNGTTHTFVGPTGNIASSIATGPAAGARDVGGTSTVTITIATPAVISWTSHGQVAGNQVQFTTTGALPTGIVAGTVYYVSSAGLTSNSFEIADTYAHALAGTNSIATSGTQSGTQTATMGFYYQGQTAYFYFIWGSGPGISTLNSARGPMTSNGAGGIGPLLPAGYTNYALAAPVNIGTATSSGNTYPSLNWNVTGALYSHIRFRGNRAYFTQSLLRTPAVGTTCCTVMDISDVIPTYYSTTNIEFDAEFNTSSASGPYSAGYLVYANSVTEPDLNISVYGNLAPASGIYPWANTLVADLPATSIELKWDTISGTLPANFNSAQFIRGYTWQ